MPAALRPTVIRLVQVSRGIALAFVITMCPLCVRASAGRGLAVRQVIAGQVSKRCLSSARAPSLIASASSAAVGRWASSSSVSSLPIGLLWTRAASRSLRPCSGPITVASRLSSVTYCLLFGGNCRSLGTCEPAFCMYCK